MIQQCERESAARVEDSTSLDDSAKRHAVKADDTGTPTNFAQDRRFDHLRLSLVLELFHLWQQVRMERDRGLVHELQVNLLAWRYRKMPENWKVVLSQWFQTFGSWCVCDYDRVAW